MRALGALLIGLLVGSCGTLVPVGAAKPGPVDSFCTGNGKGGQRVCQLDVERGVHRLKIELLKDGRWQADVKMEWLPAEKQWRVVR